MPNRRPAARRRWALPEASETRGLFTRASALGQKLLAAALEHLAALVDRHRFLQRHLALFEPPDDRFHSSIARSKGRVATSLFFSLLIREPCQFSSRASRR